MITNIDVAKKLIEIHKELAAKYSVSLPELEKTGWGSCNTCILCKDARWLDKFHGSCKTCIYNKDLDEEPLVYPCIDNIYNSMREVSDKERPHYIQLISEYLEKLIAEYDN